MNNQQVEYVLLFIVLILAAIYLGGSSPDYGKYKHSCEDKGGTVLRTDKFGKVCVKEFKQIEVPNG